MQLTILGDSTLAHTAITCCREVDHHLIPITHTPVIWVCYDMPLEHPTPVKWLCQHLTTDLASCLTPAPLVLLSTQVPIGTTAKLEQQFPHAIWAYSPENIRTAHAVADFQTQARIIVGRRIPHKVHDTVWSGLLSPFTSLILWTNPETAELTKHAINSYLGMMIAFINELALLAGMVGANIEDVEHALLTEPRISAFAPLRAGAPFHPRGHLSRDLVTVKHLANTLHLSLPLLTGILSSNDQRASHP